MKQCTKCNQIKKAANQPSRHCDRSEFNRRQRERYRQKRLAGWTPKPRTPEQQARYTKNNNQFYREHRARQLAKAHVHESVRRAERIIRDATLSRRIRRPVIFKMPYCPMCGRPTQPQSLDGHHYRGYEHRLDVVNVCRECHGSITAAERDAVCEGLPSIAGLARIIRDRRADAFNKMPFITTRQLPGYNAIVEDQNLEVRHAG